MLFILPIWLGISAELPKEAYASMTPSALNTLHITVEIFCENF